MNFHFPVSKRNGSFLVVGLIVAAAIVVGGIIAYLVTDGFGKNKPSSNLVTTQESDNKAADKSKTNNKLDDQALLLADAQAKGYTVKCVFNGEDGKGTFYMNGKDKMRFDVETDEVGMAHMVRQPDAMYTWSDNEKAGIKFLIGAEDIAENNESDIYDTDTYVEDAEKYNLKCERAKGLSNSFFKAPSDIKFVDPTDFSNYNLE